MYKVLLYYKYQKIDQPKRFAAEHLAFCEHRNLVGRILIGDEGINGTCAGKEADIEAYKEYVHSKEGFEDLWFKEHEIDHLPLPGLKIKVRKEIVTLGADVDPENGGEHISPEQFNELFEKSKTDDSIVFLDVRNKIESDVGKFKGAITPNIRFFRELKKEVKDLAYLKDKTVITYCTGGIRCEKASALLKKEGFKDVKQLNGGIYNYCDQFPEGHFEGTCFVFDDRMQIGISKQQASEEIPEDKVISHCELCNKKSGRVVNDERKAQRALMICCEECDKKHDVSRVRFGEEKRATV